MLLITLAEACSRYGCPKVFHSDKGAQCTPRRFRDDLRLSGIKQRMTGDRGWNDNVITERVIWRNKNECARIRDPETGS